MQEGSEQSSFQIVLESEEIEQSTEYWQKQCSILYNSINRNLSEGSIEPLSYGPSGDERGIITLFSTLIAKSITANVFGKVLELIKVWLENRPLAKITIKCPDESTFEISNMSLSSLLEFFNTHQNLSICESFALIKNSQKEILI
ncbi:MAG TPA: hypothetical protein VGK06_02235 [Methanosarcina sp.]|jgi:hypothetical protein